MTARTVHLVSVSFLRKLFAPKPRRRCSICGGRLLLEANSAAAQRWSGVITADVCERPHPITSIPGMSGLASVYRPWFHAEEYDLVIAQIAGAHAVSISKVLYESGKTSLRDHVCIATASGGVVDDAIKALIEARGEDALDVLLERLAKLREGA